MTPNKKDKNAKETKIDAKIEAYLKVFNNLKILSKMVLEQDKHHVPIFFLIKPDLSMEMCAMGTLEKEQYVPRIKAETMRLNAEAYIHISEGWFVERKKGEAELPSQADDRQECLVVAMATKSGFKKMVMFPFKRTESNKIVYDNEVDEADKVGGRFMELFG